VYTVYRHICPNNKIYVGITKLSAKARWGKNGILYKNQYFYRAIQKYGWDNIKHEIMFENLTKEDAEAKEKELIEKYRSNQREYGYNIENGGYVHYHTQYTRVKMSQTRRGRKLSEEHKKALSESRKGIKFSELHIQNISKSHKGYIMPESQKEKISRSCKGKGTKGVIKCDLYGNEIEIYNSLNEAVTAVNGKSSSNISSCCKGKKKSAYGYIWKYA
jgi:hypothetical protein